MVIVVSNGRVWSMVLGVMFKQFHCISKYLITIEFKTMKLIVLDLLFNLIYLLMLSMILYFTFIDLIKIMLNKILLIIFKKIFK